MFSVDIRYNIGIVFMAYMAGITAQFTNIFKKMTPTNL